MAIPRPLFLMGSKRSGTTIAVNVLNAHPRLFVSHEADTAWILYQARNGRPARFEPHPLDSDMLLRSTLRRHGRVLRSTLGDPPTHAQLVEAFYGIQTRLLRDYMSPSLSDRLWRFGGEVGKRPSPRRLWQVLRKRRGPVIKDALAWIGDKKHAQHLDPEVQSFLRSHFPDARYIHLVRHPAGAVGSMLEAAKEWYVMPEYFMGTTEEILEQWAIHEEWALQAIERDPTCVLVVRLEDLCADPVATTTRVLDFLDLQMTDSYAADLLQHVRVGNPNRRYAGLPLPEVARAGRIMELYGYADQGRTLPLPPHEAVVRRE
ncbi:MAG: sulfotransferase [Longimicrobiaceae bacterium]